MTRGKAALTLAALVPLLGGCAAVVVLPAVMGAGLMARSDHRVRAATKVARGSPTVELKTEQAKAAVAGLEGTATPVAGLTALPPPDTETASAPWAAFVTYALAQAQAKPPQSALLVPNPGLDKPVRRTCSSPTPAVIVDLDDGATPFVPARAVANPTLALGLGRLREAGTVVLWITRLPAAQAPEVAQWVRASGLDPKGEDQFLLLRTADDRKQLLREDANKDVCVVAVAGNARGDFDELFDYLRDPAGAIGLEPMMGRGWFEVPPVSAAAAIQPAHSPASQPVP